MGRPTRRRTHGRLTESEDPDDQLFRGSLDAVVRSDPDAVEGALETAEVLLFAMGALAADPSVEEQLVGLPPPRRILRGTMDDAAALSAALERVDQRWRLDAVLALQDYID